MYYYNSKSRPASKMPSETLNFLLQHCKLFIQCNKYIKKIGKSMDLLINHL